MYCFYKKSDMYLIAKYRHGAFERLIHLGQTHYCSSREILQVSRHICHGLKVSRDVGGSPSFRWALPASRFVFLFSFSRALLLSGELPGPPSTLIDSFSLTPSLFGGGASFSERFVNEGAGLAVGVALAFSFFLFEGIGASPPMTSDCLGDFWSRFVMIGYQPTKS
ncbi:hypothetical protein HDV63DRAFT_343675 [Trichoderma sp. SZMC 28014]